MNFLFLDVEWQSPKDSESLEDAVLLQIAALECSENLEPGTAFYKIIQPEDMEAIEETTLGFMNLGRKHLLASGTEKMVLEMFKKRYQEFEVLVVWSQDAYAVFEYSMKKNKIHLPKHRVVILQDLLLQIYKKIGFERALKAFDVQYVPSLLHCAKHDVKYLHRLFVYIWNSYTHDTKRNKKKKLCGLTNSPVIHKENCRMLARAKNENLVERNVNDILSGYLPCKICMTEALPKVKSTSLKKLPPAEQFDDEVVGKMCKQFQLQYSISDGLIFVRSSYSSWRIFHNYKEIEVVYHENYNKLRRVDHIYRKIGEGYHQQEIYATTLYGVLEYIYRHEKGFMKSKNKDQRRLERLFELVKRERIERERMEQELCDA